MRNNKSKIRNPKKMENYELKKIIGFIALAIIFIGLGFAICQIIDNNKCSKGEEKQEGDKKAKYMGYCVIDSARCGPKGFQLGDKSPVKLVTTEYVLPPNSEMPSGMIIVPESVYKGKIQGPLRNLPMILVNYAQSVITGPGEAFDNVLPIIEKYNKPPPGTHRVWKNYGTGALLQIVGMDYSRDDLTFTEIPNNPDNTKPGGPDSANIVIVNETSVVGGCDSNSMCVVRKF